MRVRRNFMGELRESAHLAYRQIAVGLHLSISVVLTLERAHLIAS